MKPICKQESVWQMWRYDNVKVGSNQYHKYEKRQMVRARRRYLKQELRDAD